MNKSESEVRRALDLLDLVLTNKVVIEGLEKNAFEKLRAMGTVLYWSLYEPVSDAQKETVRQFEELLKNIEKTWSQAQDHQSLNE